MIEEIRERLMLLHFPAVEENHTVWFEDHLFIWNNNQWSYANAKMIDGEIVED